MQIIEVIVDEPALVPILGIRRFLVLDPTMLTARIVAENKLEITALKRGSTLMHVWDSAGLKSARVTAEVKQIKAAEARNRQRQLEAQRLANIKVDYYYDYEADTQGPNPQNVKQQTRTDDHRLIIAGPTPYGKFDTSMWLERRSILQTDYREIFFDDRDVKIKLLQGNIGPLRNFDFTLGDNYLNFSDLVFSGYRFRGATYGTSGHLDAVKLKQPFAYTLFWGRSELGGPTGVYAEANTKFETFYAGLKADYQANEHLRFFATQINRYGEYKVDRGDRTFSVGTILDYDFFDLRSEAAHDGTNYAYKVSGDLKLAKFLQFDFGFRNIQSKFFATTGRPLEQGITGGKFGFRFSPTDFLSFFSDLDYYRDKLSLNPADPGKYNLVYSVGSQASAPNGTSIALNYRNSNLTGTLSPTEGDNFEVKVSRTFKFEPGWLARNLSCYFDYQLRNSTNLDMPANDYGNKKYEGGLTLGLPWGASLSYSYQYNSLLETANNIRTHPTQWRASANFSHKIFRPLSYDGYLSYTNARHALSPFSFVSSESLWECNSGLTYKPTPNQDYYFRVNFAEHFPESPASADYTEIWLYAGGHVKFDTGIAIQPKCTIKGRVYRDLNHNDKIDKDEPPMPGVKVYIGKRVVTTDKQGQFIFTAVKGTEAEVSIDIASLAPGSTFSTPSSKKVDVVQGRTIEVNFGVIPRLVVKGFVFCDVEENGVFDNNDFGLEGVAISLKSGEGQETSREGAYEFESVPVGTNEVSLSLTSLPVGYLPAGPVKAALELQEGQVKRVDFAMRAQRIVLGYVFEDANADGIFQKGERVFPGVKVTCGELYTFTDKDGRYIFSDLKAAEQIITIDESSLPYGFIAVRNRLIADLPAGYITLSGKDFPVGTREKILELFSKN